MRKELGIKSKNSIITKQQEGAAHEAGHILGYLAISKIKNGRKYDLKTLRILNREQAEKIVLDTYGPVFLKNNLPDACTFMMPKPRIRITQSFLLYQNFQEALLGLMGFNGTFFLYSLYEKQIDHEEILYQCKTDCDILAELISKISTQTHMGREIIFQILNKNSNQILHENAVLFLSLKEAIVDMDFELSNEQIIRLVRKYGFQSPESIQLDIDNLRHFLNK